MNLEARLRDEADELEAAIPFMDYPPDETKAEVALLREAADALRRLSELEQENRRLRIWLSDTAVGLRGTNASPAQIAGAIERALALPGRCDVPTCVYAATHTGPHSFAFDQTEDGTALSGVGGQDEA